MQQVTFRGQLITHDNQLYSNYVFRNLDMAENQLEAYVTLTYLPNWESPIPLIGEESFITFNSVRAGEMYMKKDGSYANYKGDGMYFVKAVAIPSLQDNKNIYKF